ARFPFHQHGGAHGRHLLDLDQHFLDGGGLADDAGALLQLAALDQAAHGRGYFRRVGRLGELAGPAEPPGESLGIRLGVLNQAERGDRAVARQTEQLDGTRLVQPACHDDAVGRGLAPYGLPRLVERVRQGGVEPRRLERRVDADGVLQIVRGDEDAVRHRLRCAVRRARLPPLRARSPGPGLRAPPSYWAAAAHPASPPPDVRSRRPRPPRSDTVRTPLPLPLPSSTVLYRPLPSSTVLYRPLPSSTVL